MPLRTDITLRQTVPAAVVSGFLDITLHDVTSAGLDIVLREALPPLVASQLSTIILAPVVITDTLDAPPGGVYPVPPDVRLGVLYGPTGADFSGTYAPSAGAVYRPLGSPVVRALQS